MTTGPTAQVTSGVGLVGDVLIVSSGSIVSGLASTGAPNVIANQVELRSPAVGASVTQPVNINTNLLRLTLPASVVASRVRPNYTLTPNPPQFEVFSVAAGVGDPAWFSAGFFGIGERDIAAQALFAPLNNTGSASDAGSQAGEDPSVIDWSALAQTVEPFGRGQPPICLPADQSEDEESACGGQEQAAGVWPNRPVLVFTANGLKVRYLGHSGRLMR